jgi:hypothetical protein
MVDEGGQLYTIEGLAAGLVMIATAYIVLGSTVVYTPGDTHISDMQLETLGHDVLKIMDTPAEEALLSDLRSIVTNNDATTFRDIFLLYCNATTRGASDNLQFSALVSHRDASGNVSHYQLAESRTMTSREHAVRVTRWALIDNRAGTNPQLDHRRQIVLVEVVLWRA